MKETLLFRSKINGPLPIELPDGNSISVAAKGYFRCTPEEAECPSVKREKGAKRIVLVERIVEKNSVEPVLEENVDVESVVVDKSPANVSVIEVIDEPVVVDNEKYDDSLTSSSEMVESGEELGDNNLDDDDKGRESKKASKKKGKKK
jgi:hypothetical protein